MMVPNHKIYVRNNLILYQSKMGVDYYSFNSDLLSILKDKVYYGNDRRTNRTRFTIVDNGSTRHIRAHDLALGCYMGLINKDTFMKDLEEFTRYKCEKGVEVDHLDGHGENNTMLNLSLMEKTVNRRKRDIVQRVKFPNALNAVYIGSTYRIELFTCLDSRGVSASLRFICDDADEFLERLTWITGSSFEWAPPIKDGSGRWVPNDNPALSDDVRRSISYQEFLSALPEDMFMRSKDYPHSPSVLSFVLANDEAEDFSKA